MKIYFTKMQGAGNDYIYINAFDGEEKYDMPKIARTLSDRHFSVGGDGVVFLCKSNICDCKMRMFNTDGSEGKMCGNASRCIAKYLYEKGLVKKENITLETLSGIKKLSLSVCCGKVKEVTVNMGKPAFEPKNIPSSAKSTQLDFMGKSYLFTAVSMGNPHAVAVVDEVKTLDIKSVAEVLQNDKKLFPESVNVEFVKILSENKLEMRVYERGSGETLACGTGACAVVAALVENGKLKKGETEVQLLGGALKIFYDGGDVLMTGGAEFAFEGETFID